MMEVDYVQNMAPIGSIVLPGSSALVTISTGTYPTRAILVPFSPPHLLRLLRITCIAGDVVTAGGSSVSMALYRLRGTKGGLKTDTRASKQREVELVSQGVRNITTVSDTRPCSLNLPREIHIYPDHGLYYVGIQPSNENTMLFAPATALAGGAYTTANFTFGAWPDTLTMVEDATVIPFIALRSARGILHTGSISRD